MKVSKFSRLLAVLSLALLSVAGSVSAEQRLWVKYLNKFVDVDRSEFESLDTSESSLVEGAWYDKSNGYMIINLKGTNYHYCSMPNAEWEAFRNADSFGSFYVQRIKGRWDCRINPVPSYD